jgi:hypothetical protein
MGKAGCLSEEPGTAKKRGGNVHKAMGLNLSNKKQTNKQKKTAQNRLGNTWRSSPCPRVRGLGDVSG